MGRKSLAEERRAEILAAFARCIARHGLDASLEQIADEAGMRRSIIRHYIGNRDELVNELITQIAHEYPQQISAALRQANVADLLDYMFRPLVQYSDWDAIIIAVLTAAKERYPLAQQKLRSMFEQLIELLRLSLASAYPHAHPTRLHQIAYAIFCLSQTNETLLWLGLPSSYNDDARASAELLLGALEAGSDQL